MRTQMQTHKVEKKILRGGTLRDHTKKAEKESISSTAFHVRNERLDSFNYSLNSQFCVLNEA